MTGFKTTRSVLRRLPAAGLCLASVYAGAFLGGCGSSVGKSSRQNRRSGASSIAGLPGHDANAAAAAKAASSAASPPPPAPPASFDAACQAGPAPLQRLTYQQYVNSSLSLLALPPAAASQLVLPTDQVGAAPFSANNTQAVALNDAYLYLAAAEALASAAASSQFAGILPCSFANLNAACASEFVTQFGARAFRRPLTSDEAAAFATAMAPQLSAGDVSGAVQTAIQVVLASPDFLYLPQLGSGAGSASLSQFEIASRLSYSLWNSTPDATLLAAAAANQLTPDGIKVQATRMVADPRFGATAAVFIKELLALQGVAGLSKDLAQFPSYNAALAQAIAQETADFTSYVFLKGDGRLQTLMTANYSVLTPPLFDFYGITQPAAWQAGQVTPLPTSGPGARTGLLNQAAYLSAHAHPNATNIVERGRIIRANLLCTPLPSPPANVPVLPPRIPGAQTARQVFATHESNASCAGCHTLMDSFGLAFEHFDATGAWRAADGSLPIDASGSYSSAHVKASAFADSSALASDLASNIDVQNCVVLQTFRFINKRLETAADACTIQQLQQQFAASQQDLRSLMVQIVTSKVFSSLPNGGQ